MRDLRKHPYLPTFFAAFCGAASFLPAFTVLGFISISYSQTGDGKLLLGAVVLGGGGAALLRRRGGRRLPAALDTVAAGLALATVLYDMNSAPAIVSATYGAYLLMLGAAGWLGAGIARLFGRMVTTA